MIERIDEGNHDVYEDGAGTGGHYRLTCRSCPDEDPSTRCTRQPYMTQAQWEEAERLFRQQHPWTGKPKRYPGE